MNSHKPKQASREHTDTVLSPFFLVTTIYVVRLSGQRDLPERIQDGVDIINFDLSWVISAGCFLDVVFHDQLLWTTIAPIIIMGLLGGTYAAAVRKHGESSTAIRNAQQKHVSMALLVTFLVYSSVSSTVFQMFAREELEDGKRYLLADYTIECTSFKHKAL